MELNEAFENVLTFANGMQTWMDRYFASVGNYKRKYTFMHDMAIAEWVSGWSGVMDTYNKLLNEYGGNYKAFTELVMSVNLMAFAHEQLSRQEIDNMEGYIEKYSDLYYEARDAFYKKYEGNDEACSYFFDTTD